MRRSLSQIRTRLLGQSPKPPRQGGGAPQAAATPETASAARPWAPLNHDDVAIVRLNPQGQITEADARALALLHGTLADLLGHDFWDAVAEDITEQYQSATGKALSRSAHHAFVAHHEFEGSWVEYTFTLQPGGALVTLRDVTRAQGLLASLADSEHCSQLIFDANPNAMWLFERGALQIVAANQAAVRFYGIAHAEFVTLRMGALFPDGEGAALLNSLAPGRAVPLRMRLCKQRKRDGQVVLVELAWGFVSWRGQQAVLVSLADVTERHLADSTLMRANDALEEELAAQQIQMEKLRHDLAAFTAAVSSDMQDALHVANGFASALAEKYSAVLDEPGRHYVDRIQASTRQLARLVDDLRTLAQLPLRPNNPEEVDLAPRCKALIAGLRKREPARQVTIELPDAMPLVGDASLLMTALASLLDNAWKFTSKRAEAWIKVALLPGKTPGERVLQVSDNGAGFDAAYSDRLFTAFARLHSSAEFPGNGLGLAIVKAVAEKHGGRVWAETTELIGSSFFMALPQPQASQSR